MAVTAAILALAICRRAALVERRGRRSTGASSTSRCGSRSRSRPPARSTLTLSIPAGCDGAAPTTCIPDHGHLMHLFLVRAPGLDAIAHLHPRRTGEATFAQAAPPLPAGSYRLFGDIVHQTGLDETVTASLELGRARRPVRRGRDRFDPDDAERAHSARGDRRRALVHLRRRQRPPALARRARPARRPDAWCSTSRSRSPTAAPLAGIQPYMGMAGHAMIVARDLTVFAHVHPTGSVPMAAMALVEDAGRRPFAPPRDDVRAARPVPRRLPARRRLPRCSCRSRSADRVETAAWDVDVRGSGAGR